MKVARDRAVVSPHPLVPHVRRVGGDLRGEVLSLHGRALPGEFHEFVDITGVAPVRTDGTVSDPTWQGQVNIRYRVGDFGFFTSFNYIGEQLFSRATRGLTFREIDKYDDYWIINPSISWDVNKQFRWVFSVTNLTDYKGQTYQGFILPASYQGGNPDLGRRFAMTVQAKF